MENPSYHNMSPIPGLIILSCWIVFVAYWLISAFGVKATAERGSFSTRLTYRIPLIIGGIILGKFHQPYPLSLAVTPQTFVTAAIGAAVCVAGLCVAIWSRWTLGGNWSSEVTFKVGHQLVKTGPYRLVRHPIYTGVLLMCLGPVIQFGRLHCWLGLAIIALGLWIKLKQEEAIMLRHFPDYSDYCKEVKALIPFVI